MTTFRVLQFNMQFGQGWSDQDPHVGRTDLDATIAEIRRHDADIILLQEVEQALPGGHQVDPPPNYSRLQAALAGYDSWFAYPKADARELPFGLGLAIFSRTPLRNTTKVDLPSPPISFQFEGQTLTPTDRLLIEATTTVQGRDLRVINTHLLAFFMLGTSSRAHPGQRARVLEQVSSSSVPAVIGGDFNVRDHANLSAQFAASGYRTVQSEQITWRRQPFVLDHVFFNDSLRLVHQQVEPTMTSDHHLLVADFSWT